MKPEKQYEIALQLLQMFEGYEKFGLAKDVIEHPESFGNGTYVVYDLLSELIIDARAHMDKQTVRSSLPALKRVIKSADRPDLQGLFETEVDGEKWFAILDGFRAFRLKSDVTSLPHVKGFPVESMTRIFYDPSRNEDVLNVPTVPQIKEFISQCKVSGLDPKRTPIEVDGMWFNPQFLIDAMEILPGCVFYKPEKRNHPVYCKSDDGDGIILPVHHA